MFFPTSRYTVKYRYESKTHPIYEYIYTIYIPTIIVAFDFCTQVLAIEKIEIIQD